jgi:RHS repeat-associated protein
VTTAAGARTIGYDGRGNTATETRPGGVSVAAAYDGYGRLTGYARTGDPVQTNVYNGLDDRVAVTSGAATRRFVYDMDGRVLGEYGTSAADVKAEFIWLSPEVANDNAPFGGDDGVGGYAPLAVAVADGAGGTRLNWVHGNHLGVPQATTDATGAIQPNGGDYQLPGFPGQSRTFADLYYNRHRDYDPSAGRYIQADPIGLDGGDNPYLYAEGNPVTGIDPWGLQAAAPTAGRAPAPSAGEVARFAADWWLKRQARPGRNTPWGRAWGVGEALGAAAAVAKYCYDQSGSSGGDGDGDDGDDRCDKEYDNNIATCGRIFGKTKNFAGCAREAMRVYKNCLSGDRISRPFNPYAEYRGKLPF